MKNSYLSILALLISAVCIAQQGINYKALIKDSNGDVVANQTVTVQFSILENVTSVYQETQNPTSDANGIIVVNIGEGTVDSGDFSIIDWDSDDYFLNVEVDIGAGLVDLGTTQFMAVPYALNAANVTGLETLNEGNGVGWRLKGKDPAKYDNVGENAVDLSTSYYNVSFYGASGNHAIAMGRNTRASGDRATAMGSNTRASGDGATTMGLSTEASGLNATAMGVSTEASGDSATALGTGSIASGVFSTAMGYYTEASGHLSTALGKRTIAGSTSATALGAFNVGGGNATIWMETDPLFEIGNGVDDANRFNAFTVLKNGHIGVGKYTDIGGLVEIQTNSTPTHPQLTLIEDNASYARLKFKNTNRNGDDYWDIAGFIGTDVAEDRLNFYNSDAGNIMSIEGDGKVKVNGDLAVTNTVKIGTTGVAISEIIKITGITFFNGIGGTGTNSIPYPPGYNWENTYVVSFKVKSTEGGVEGSSKYTTLGNYNSVDGNSIYIDLGYEPNPANTSYIKLHISDPQYEDAEFVLILMKID